MNEMYKATDFMPRDFMNKQLTQKQNGQENLDLKTKYAFVNKLHTNDLALRQYFATIITSISWTMCRSSLSTVYLFFISFSAWQQEERQRAKRTNL